MTEEQNAGFRGQSTDASNWHRPTQILRSPFLLLPFLMCIIPGLDTKNVELKLTFEVESSVTSNSLGLEK